MPEPDRKRYAGEWLEKAQQDFQRVERRLKEGDAEDAAFHLQQAIEKFLKGYLLSTGWELKRIHDLEALLDDAIRVASDLERYRPLCQQVTGYYLTERYPALGESPSAEEVRSALEATQGLMRWIRERVRG